MTSVTRPYFHNTTPDLQDQDQDRFFVSDRSCPKKRWFQTTSLAYKTKTNYRVSACASRQAERNVVITFLYVCPSRCGIVPKRCQNFGQLGRGITLVFHSLAPGIRRSSPVSVERFQIGVISR